MPLKVLKTERGDTLLEVVFAFVIFSIVVAVSLGSMNAGITSAEAALELTQARNEIDAQAEALRFIHNSFVSDAEFMVDDNVYRLLWVAIREHAITSQDNLPVITNQISCDGFYDLEQNSDAKNIYDAKAFVINTRKIGASTDPNSDDYYLNTIQSASRQNDLFSSATLYPRVIYGKDNSDETMDDTLIENDVYNEVKKVEGLWITAVPEATAEGVTPDFFDFHISTCWYAPGKDLPTTIGTIVRLYNPQVITSRGGS